MKEHAVHLELVEIAEASTARRERRSSEESSRTVQNGIVLATFEGCEAGAKYMRDRGISVGVTHRVLHLNQRRSGDWK